MPLAMTTASPGGRALLPTPLPMGQVVTQPQRLWGELQGRARGVGSSVASPRLTEACGLFAEGA